MNKVLNITVMLLVLAALSFSMIGCNGESDQKVNEVLGTDVKLNGTWKSNSVSYTHEGKTYTGTIELRFDDTRMQIVAPHGTSRIHKYVRDGLKLTVTDPYIDEDNSFRDIPLALEFADSGFSVEFIGLTFTDGLSNIKLKFSKISDNASIKEPEKETDTPEDSTPLVAFKIEGTTLTGLTNYGKTLESIVLPNIITSIGDHAFYGCDSLTSITIPSSVTKIGHFAFLCCTGLTSVTISDGVTEIGRDAFSGCSSLTEATYGGTIEQWYAIEYAMPYDVTCQDGKVVFKIQKSTSESTVNISVRGLTPYGKANCTEIVIPDGVTSIEWGAFYGYTGLTSVTIPSSVTTIEGYAFEGCSSLTSITLPGSVKSIGDWAFRNCTGLTSVTIQDGVTEIGINAFRDCTNLTSVTLPDSVTSIGGCAFFDSSSLTEVTYGGTIEQWYALGYAMPSTIDVICTNGKAVFRIEKDTNYDGIEYTSVEGLTPYGKANFTEITIPEGVTSIESKAFYSCTSLTSINIPSSVTEIEYDAFYGCTGLTSITIPKGVTSIEWDVFSGCTSLTNIYVNQAESNLLESSSVPEGCTIHWNSTGPESV